jgi:flagellar motility protein MotE (MotC chaperone)
MKLNSLLNRKLQYKSKLQAKNLVKIEQGIKNSQKTNKNMKLRSYVKKMS